MCMPQALITAQQRALVTRGILLSLVLEEAGVSQKLSAAAHAPITTAARQAWKQRTSIVLTSFTIGLNSISASTSSWSRTPGAISVNWIRLSLAVSTSSKTQRSVTYKILLPLLLAPAKVFSCTFRRNLQSLPSVMIRSFPSATCTFKTAIRLGLLVNAA